MPDASWAASCSGANLAILHAPISPGMLQALASVLHTATREPEAFMLLSSGALEATAAPSAALNSKAVSLCAVPL